MSDRMTCPGCDAESSSVLYRVRDGDPCPFCGLKADTIMEILAVRETLADEKLKQSNEDLLKRVATLEKETVKWRRFADRVRTALSQLDSGDEETW